MRVVHASRERSNNSPTPTSMPGSAADIASVEFVRLEELVPIAEGNVSILMRFARLEKRERSAVAVLRRGRKF